MGVVMGVGWHVRIGYGCGHAQNDLCAAMYFSYLLLFLDAVGLSPLGAGAVMIFGQFADGIATPAVGHFSDRTTCLPHGGCCWGRLGRRKLWYLGGALLVSSTYWLLFTPPSLMLSHVVTPSRSTQERDAQLVVYFTILNCLFQLGWASVQVSHMSLVPELTTHLFERVTLNSIRFAVTVASSISVYVLVWILSERDSNVKHYSHHHTQHGHPGSTNATALEAQRLILMERLQIICYAVLSFGALAAVVFFLLVIEESRSKSDGRESVTDQGENQQALGAPNVEAVPNEVVGERSETRTLWAWFHRPGFAGVAATYACTRLCVNCFQLYLPFYVVNTMASKLPQSAIATAPLTAYVAMCISSVLAPKITARLQDALAVYILGTFLTGTGATILLLANGDSELLIYFATVLVGLGNALLMVTCQTQVCELVGGSAHGAIVFGFNSFLDKVSTGLLIYAIQRATGIASSDPQSLSALFRVSVAAVPLASALVGCFAVSCVPKSIRARNNCSLPSDDCASDISVNDGGAWSVRPSASSSLYSSSSAASRFNESARLRMFSMPTGATVSSQPLLSSAEGHHIYSDAQAFSTR